MPPLLAASDPTLMMRPHLRCFMPGSTARAQKNAPSTFTASTRRHSWSLVDSAFSLEETPALFTRMSTGPNAFSTCWSARFTASASLTSHGTATVGPRRKRIMLSRRMASTSTSATCAPSSSSPRTTASPMVPAAPVTTAVFPASTVIDTSPLHDLHAVQLLLRLDHRGHELVAQPQGHGLGERLVHRLAHEAWNRQRLGEVRVVAHVLRGVGDGELHAREVALDGAARHHLEDVRVERALRHPLEELVEPHARLRSHREGLADRG